MQLNNIDSFHISILSLLFWFTITILNAQISHNSLILWATYFINLPRVFFYHFIEWVSNNVIDYVLNIIIYLIFLFAMWRVWRKSINTKHSVAPMKGLIVFSCISCWWICHRWIFSKWIWMVLDECSLNVTVY